MNLTELKETPDYSLKDITVNEITEKQLANDLNNIAPDKLDAFKLKAKAELTDMNNSDKAFNAEGKAAEKLLGSEKISIGTGENKVNLGSLIDAELATKMIDTLVPALFVLILRLGVGITVDKKELQASNKELEMMQPIVQKCLEVIEFNINNPFIALGVVMGVVYSTKAATIGVDKFMNQKDGKIDPETGEKKARKPRSDAGQKRK